jgi:hypothetical protein
MIIYKKGESLSVSAGAIFFVYKRGALHAARWPMNAFINALVERRAYTGRYVHWARNALFIIELKKIYVLFA